MQHVDEGLLHAWLDGERAALGPARAEEVRRHLDGCAECRTRLGEARDLRDRADALLRGGSPVGAEIPPFESLAGRVPARRSRTRMLAWAASLVLALGAGWLARGAPDPGEPSARAAAAPRPAPSPAVPSAPAVSAPAGTAVVVPAPAPAVDAATARRAGPRPLPQVAARGDAPPPAAADLAAMEATPVPPPPPPPAAAPPPVAESRAPAPAEAPAAAPPGAAEGDRSGQAARRAERVAARAPSAAGADSAELPAPNYGGTLALEGLVVSGTPTLEEVLGGAVGPDADGWFSVRPEAARRLLGREPLRVRGLPLISVQAGRWEGRAAVRVRQRLEGGGLLSLVQVPDGAKEGGESGDSAVVPDAWDEAPTDHVRLIRQVGAIVVTGSAPLTADSLAALLERLR